MISQPDKTYGGVIQYDLIKNLGDEVFVRKGFLKPPPTMLLAALATLWADHNLDDSQMGLGSRGIEYIQASVSDRRLLTWI